jgi:thioredoxin-related protein
MLNLKGTILKANDFTIKGSNVFVKKCKNKLGMLLIAADFCGHCHRFVDTFNEIYDIVGKDFCMTSIENEELQKLPSLSKSLNFQGFPTIKFFNQSGQIIGEYNKERNKESILQEICKVYHHCHTTKH